MPSANVSVDSMFGTWTPSSCARMSPLLGSNITCIASLTYSLPVSSCSDGIAFRMSLTSCVLSRRCKLRAAGVFISITCAVAACNTSCTSTAVGSTALGLILISVMLGSYAPAKSPSSIVTRMLGGIFSIIAETSNLYAGRSALGNLPINSLNILASAIRSILPVGPTALRSTSATCGLGFSPTR